MFPKKGKKAVALNYFVSRYLGKLASEQVVALNYFISRYLGKLASEQVFWRMQNKGGTTQG